MQDATYSGEDFGILETLLSGGSGVHDIDHTTDYNMGITAVGAMTREMFEGKDTRGIGLGGAQDPVSSPFASSEGVFPSVNNVNGTASEFFPQHRATQEMIARTSASLASTRNDVFFWNLHPMDYDPYPAVGNRHADNPALDDPAVFDRITRRAPSEYMKSNLMPVDMGALEISYRPTVAYGGRQYQRHRPLLRRGRNSDVNEAVYGKGVTSSSASDVGITAPPSRIDVLEGIRSRRHMMGFGSVTDGNLYNREQLPTNIASYGYAQHASANQRDHAVTAGQLRRDNLMM